MVIKKLFIQSVRGSEPHGKHKEEKDQRTQELRLVFSRPIRMRIKRKEKVYGNEFGLSIG